MNTKEPKPKKAAPDMPSWLSVKAKRAWPIVVKLLGDMGVLTKADGIALELLCESYADYLSARGALKGPVKGKGRAIIAKAGERTYVTYGKSGAMIRNRPELADIADADRRLKQSLADFGLTPAARSRIQAADAPEEKDPEAPYFDE